MNDVIITSPCGNLHWRGRSNNIPRIGEAVTCRIGRDLEIEFDGEVEDVHYEVRKGFGVNEGNSQDGMIARVYLRELKP